MNFTLTGSPTTAQAVPAVEMDLPPAQRPWDTSDSALVAAVAAGDGHVTVALKAVESPRVLDSTGETGIRYAVTEEEISAGIDALAALGVEFVYYLDKIGAAWLRIDPAVAPALRALPVVDYLEPRQYRELAAIPMPRETASELVGAVAQSTPWGITKVNAHLTWSYVTGQGVSVYIIDTGHYQGHEDLPLVSSSNCGGAYGGCDDGPLWHGTHVMGSALARNNSLGVVGVAPGVNNADVYVWGACDSYYGLCSSQEITTGINAAIFNADVINMSFGGINYSADEANAVAAAWADDIVLVAAAGNAGNNTVRYPAGYTNVLGVSGIKPDNTFASSSPCGGGSSYGTHVDLAGPFWALSTVGYNAYEDETDGWCGTSMATPHVTGTVALIRQKYPTASNSWVVSRITGTATDLGAGGRDDYFGYGLVNAYAATRPLSASISGPDYIDTKGTYTWTANYSGGVGSSPSYQWYVFYIGDTKEQTLGTSSSQSMVVSAGPDFEMRLRVTLGGEVARDTMLVRNCISGCDEKPPLE